MTVCQLFRCSPSTQETPCQVMNHLLQVRSAPCSGPLGSTFFPPAGESLLPRFAVFGEHKQTTKKKKENSQSKSSLPIPPSRHTSGVSAINDGCDKSDGASDKCLSERGNTHFKQRKVAGLQRLGFVTF